MKYLSLGFIAIYLTFVFVASFFYIKTRHSKDEQQSYYEAVVVANGPHNNQSEREGSAFTIEWSFIRFGLSLLIVGTCLFIISAIGKYRGKPMKKSQYGAYVSIGFGVLIQVAI
ncbi:MAG: hypothetical protein ACKOXB_04445 [Flavobacteriales bacterium]